MKLYELPECLRDKCDEAAYVRWLRRKAAAHVKRDRKRFERENCSGATYRLMIHNAVKNGGDRDHFFIETVMGAGKSPEMLSSVLPETAI